MSEKASPYLIADKYEKLLLNYKKIMFLKIFVDTNDDNLIELYTNAAKKHNDKLLNFQNWS